MRQLGTDRRPRGRETGPQINHAVGGDRIGDAFHPDCPALLAMYLVLNVGEGLIGDEDATGRRLMLEARGEVHGATDDGVVHPVLATEVSHRAITGVDTDAAAQRGLDAGVAPVVSKLADAL